jgi:hypothetical protein
MNIFNLKILSWTKKKLTNLYYCSSTWNGICKNLISPLKKCHPGRSPPLSPLCTSQSIKKLYNNRNHNKLYYRTFIVTDLFKEHKPSAKCVFDACKKTIGTYVWGGRPSAIVNSRERPFSNYVAAYTISITDSVSDIDSIVGHVLMYRQ